MSYGPEYHKIQSVFKRNERGRFIETAYSQDEFEYLRTNLWRWTEKIDGTNIRLHWNGQCVTVGGRTNNAQIPADLLAAIGRLPNKFPEVFADCPEATVFGEGYGGKIQSGGHYRPDPAFIVFDVKIGDFWLRPPDVQKVANDLGLEVVPTQGLWTLDRAVEIVKNKAIDSLMPGGARIEGIVGVPIVPLFTRSGHRVITKLKLKDWADE